MSIKSVYRFVGLRLVEEVSTVYLCMTQDAGGDFITLKVNIGNEDGV